MTEQQSLSARVEAIITDSLYTQDEIPNAGAVPPDAVIVDAITGSFGFHPQRLESHRDDIASIVGQMHPNFFEHVGGGWSFLNLCMDKDGHQWTGEHRIMESLCALAIGIEIGRWMIDRGVWSALPGGMPYIVFNSEAL